MTQADHATVTRACGKCGTSGSGDFCSTCGSALDAASGKSGALRTVVGLCFVAALLYVTFLGIPNPFGSKLDLAIEISPTESHRFGFVLITNVGKEPVELSEVRINGRTNPDCVSTQRKKLATGEKTVVATNGIFGPCGDIVRVTVVTDHGEADYKINW